MAGQNSYPTRREGLPRNLTRCLRKIRRSRCTFAVTFCSMVPAGVYYMARVAACYTTATCQTERPCMIDLHPARARLPQSLSNPRQSSSLQADLARGFSFGRRPAEWRGIRGCDRAGCALPRQLSRADAPARQLLQPIDPRSACLRPHNKQARRGFLKNQLTHRARI